ncbi:LPXTG cell wall anchor domain-containing protein [Enterococcus casseliflavus]|uniref:LPXTG cell wall anchor domain-containing protein n=1 Tax=Enterococcus sp. 8E11_MSG4843 TaxID=1834190 RepID=UPI000B3E64AE|nr:LPXTG cell wall anchor domain-containing protein [Enterococcus sp. 8E11_MSG4843]MBO1097895.1 LPXTG cell wall anchor domain-containing protein [Enterococcus casseliflavus]MBO1145443.1 LPXTG cell wall anchor domain-containing protein [Enterococcus casseliflavus]OUZ30165.1 hypothetical protein A5885_003346 [Enterococcus sp. 8E11_MSG4843]
MLRKLGRVAAVFGCLWLLQSPVHVSGSQVQSTETEGSVHFTGIYEPIGTPNPPPEGVAKPPTTVSPTPGGSLPQTNTLAQQHWGWLGMIVTGGVVSLIWRKKQLKKQ